MDTTLIQSVISYVSSIIFVITATAVAAAILILLMALFNQFHVRSRPPVSLPLKIFRDCWNTIITGQTLLPLLNNSLESPHTCNLVQHIKYSCRTIIFFNRVNRAINYFNRALTR